MTLKKKTVKELNEDMIAMENKFQEMFYNLSTKIEAFQKQVKEKTAPIATAVERVKDVNDDKFPCKRCDSSFKQKDELKVHMKQKHKMQTKCKVCEETFGFTFELEIHLKKHEVETFKCDKCEKTFYLKWRLQKHEKAHDLVDLKFCHYFNNNKPCPFEEVGCMFRHDESQECQFKQECRFKLCQNKHSFNENNTVEERQTDDANENVHSESESETEEEDLECDECGKVSDDFDAYIEHRGRGDCVYWCDHCDKFFRQEVELEKHRETHCTKCGKYFSTKSAVDKHMTNCNSI